MQERIITDTPYYDLANAIVVQAAYDYRNALKGIGYDRYTPERVIRSVEKFFRSEYFTVLTKIKGEYLIEQLKEEHRENERRNNANQET